MAARHGKSPYSKTPLAIAMVCDVVGDRVGGSFISAVRLAELLREKGHKIVFIAAKSLQGTDTYRGFRVYRFHSVLLPKTDGKLYVAFPSEREIRRIFTEKRIDILHNILPTPAALVAVRVARAMGIPVIAHSHAQPENVFLHLPKFTRGILNLSYRDYLLWVYRKADMVLFPSEFARRLLPELGSMPNEVISNGVDLKRFRKMNSQPLLAEFNIPRKERRAVFVGRLHPDKSPDTLVRAAPLIRARMPLARVYVVGDGYLEDSLKQLARDLGADEAIKFLGVLSDEHLVMAYNACDVFVLPSLAELEGMVVLEAMACGKPIVIADAPQSASRFFVKGNGFLFRPRDPQDLAEKVLAVLGNDNLRLRFGKASLELAKRYDIRKSAARLEEIYYSFVNRQR